MSMVWTDKYHEFITTDVNATEEQIAELKDNIRAKNEYGDIELEYFPINPNHTTIIDMMCPSFEDARAQLDELCPDGNYDNDVAVTFIDEYGYPALLVKYGVRNTYYNYLADR